MCIRGTREVVGERVARTGPTVSRRTLLGAGIGAGLAGLLPACAAAGDDAPADTETPQGVQIGNKLDLTHVFAPDMPVFDDEKPLTREIIQGEGRGDDEFDFYDQQWTLTEHVGTHIDPPGHVIGAGRMAPDLVPDELIVPAVVINIADKADEDPNAMLTIDDIEAYEGDHGTIQSGSAVFMDSGWAQRWGDAAAFRGGEAFGAFSFPGFDPDACEFLIEEREIVGVGVDTMSTDPGESEAFPAHETLGRGDVWGLENLANLEQMPPVGATVFIGLIPLEEGSGGPCRVIATW